jgi:hypothetical protein
MHGKVFPWPHLAEGEVVITPENVDQLQIRRVYQTTPDVPVDPLFPLTVGDVTVPPALADDVLYFPDRAGNLHERWLTLPTRRKPRPPRAAAHRSAAHALGVAPVHPNAAPRPRPRTPPHHRPPRPFALA